MGSMAWKSSELIAMNNLKVFKSYWLEKPIALMIPSWLRNRPLHPGPFQTTRNSLLQKHPL
jgi:hypothetical protein